VGSAGGRVRWGTPTPELHICTFSCERTFGGGRGPLHCQPDCLAQVDPPQKLSPYDFREPIRLFHIVKWTESVGVDFGEKPGWQ